MPENEKNPAEPANSAARAGSDDHTGQPFRTAADVLGIKQPEGQRDPRLSQSPGLVKIEGSIVPGMGDGSTVNHVTGPGQAAVDPVAAGLDMQFDPMTRHELRAPTQTGELGAGIRPSTYAEKPGGLGIQQSTEANHETVKPVVGETMTPAGIHVPSVPGSADTKPAAPPLTIEKPTIPPAATQTLPPKPSPASVAK